MEDDLDLEVREKVLVLSPHVRRAYRLEGLTPRITPRNVHKELASVDLWDERPYDEQRFPYSLTPATTRLKCRMSPILTVARI